MIPTLIAFGLIFGRWWKSALVVGVIGWGVVVLVVTDATIWHDILVIVGLALANTAAGVVVHQGALRAVRTIRGQGAHPEAA